MTENYRSPYGIWWDENIQGKYGVSSSIRELMAMAFEGGRKSRESEIEAEIEVAKKLYKDLYSKICAIENILQK
jgi:hypothetical protein